MEEESWQETQGEGESKGSKDARQVGEQEEEVGEQDLAGHCAGWRGKGLKYNAMLVFFIKRQNLKSRRPTCAGKKINKFLSERGGKLSRKRMRLKRNRSLDLENVGVHQNALGQNMMLGLKA